MVNKPKINKTKFKNSLEGSAGIITTIARKLGVSRLTLYTYIEKNSWTKELLQHEREKIIDLAENKLFKQIEKSEPWAVKYVLSTLGKNRGFTEKSELPAITIQNTQVMESTTTIADSIRRLHPELADRFTKNKAKTLEMREGDTSIPDSKRED